MFSITFDPTAGYIKKIVELVYALASSLSRKLTNARLGFSVVFKAVLSAVTCSSNFVFAFLILMLNFENVWQRLALRNRRVACDPPK